MATASPPTVQDVMWQKKECIYLNHTFICSYLSKEISGGHCRVLSALDNIQTSQGSWSPPLSPVPKSWQLCQLTKLLKAASHLIHAQTSSPVDSRPNLRKESYSFIANSTWRFGFAKRCCLPVPAIATVTLCGHAWVNSKSSSRTSARHAPVNPNLKYPPTTN